MPDRCGAIRHADYTERHQENWHEFRIAVTEKGGTWRYCIFCSRMWKLEYDSYNGGQYWVECSAAEEHETVTQPD